MGILIAGNSHAHAFRGLKVDSEEVKVLWMGAVRAVWVENSHPCFVKLVNQLQEKRGDLIFFIGFHDFSEIATTISNDPAQLQVWLNRYAGIFSLLKSKVSKLAWAVSPRVNYAKGLSDEAFHQTCHTFIAAFSAWCEANGIGVLDPVSAFYTEGGKFPANHLLPDNIHLKPRSTSLYLDLLHQNFEGSFSTPENQRLYSYFSSSSELEHFCELVCGELNVPQFKLPVDLPEVESLMATNCSQLAGAAWPQCDSSQRLQIYEKTCHDLLFSPPYDVNLSRIETAEAAAEIIADRMRRSPHAAVLHASLTGSQEADIQILSFGAAWALSLKDVVDTLEGGTTTYGAPHYWIGLSLMDHDSEGAFAEFCKASSPLLRDGVKAERILPWLKGLDGAAGADRHYQLKFVGLVAREIRRAHPSMRPYLIQNSLNTFIPYMDFLPSLEMLMILLLRLSDFKNLRSVVSNAVNIWEFHSLANFAMVCINLQEGDHAGAQQQAQRLFAIDGANPVYKNLFDSISSNVPLRLEYIIQEV